MPSATTQLNYDELKAIARTLHREGDEYIRLLFDTRRKVGDLRRDWAGDAASAFYKEMESQLLPAMGRLSQALFEAESVTNQIMKIFQDADLETVGFFKDMDAALGGVAGRKKRIYLINGINYSGNDSDFQNLKEKMQAKYGKDVEVVVVGAHPYDTNLLQYQLHTTGTQFGGWLSPIDWLSGKAADGINAASRFGLGGINTVVGVGQVVHEYITGGSVESQKVYQWIQTDLQKNGLIGDENLDVILVGHSGGGAIVGNIVDDIETKLHVNVSTVVTMGSPISNYDNASLYAEKIIDIQHPNDRVGTPLGIGTIRSDEMRVAWLYPLTNAKGPIEFIGSVFGMDQLFRDQIPAVENVTTHDSSSFWDPIGAHGSYWNSQEVVNAIGSAL